MAGYPSRRPYHVPALPGPNYHSPYPVYGLPYHHYPGLSLMPRPTLMSPRDIPPEAPETPPQVTAEPEMVDEEVSDDLLARISSAIPDLHLLLSRYKETHGELGVREQLIKKAEHQQMEILKRKEEHINALMKQIEEMKKRHSGEINKYRLQIGNIEEKQRELEEALADAEESKDNLKAALDAVEAEKADILNERRILENNHEEELDRMKDDVETEKAQFAKEKVRLLNEFESWKALAKEAIEAEKKAFRRDMKLQLKKQEEALADQRKHVLEQAEKEKESLRSDFETQKRELEDSFSKTTAELEHKVAKLQSELDEVSGKRDELSKALMDERACFEKRLEEKAEEHKAALAKEYDDRRAELVSQQAEAMAALIQQHKDDLNDQMRGFLSIQEALNKSMTAENEELKKELESLKIARYEDKSTFEAALEEAKGVAEKLEAEKGMLIALTESHLAETDVKSKGDAFYIDAFRRLSNQIRQLAASHFHNHAISAQGDSPFELPAAVPSFYDDTPSAHDVRAAYVVHLISKKIVDSIYSPFWFTSDTEKPSTADIFHDMSLQLRRKSTRGEALWRQATLYAHFSLTREKSRINAAAIALVDDIMTSVKHLAKPNEHDDVRSKIRAIVKLAIETWRYARLERERIYANFPPAADCSEEDGKTSYWPAMTFDIETYPEHTDKAVSDTAAAIQSSRKLLLRLLPVIRREPIDQSFRITAIEKADRGCVYSYGLALYDDAPPVVARRREITTSTIMHVISKHVQQEG